MLNKYMKQRVPLVLFLYFNIQSLSQWNQCFMVMGSSAADVSAVCMPRCSEVFQNTEQGPVAPD